MESLTPFIKMYSTEWCHDCKAMLALFEENNVICKIIQVDSDPVAIEKLKVICGGKKILPTIEMEGKTFINPSIDYIRGLLNTKMVNNS